MTLTDYLVTKNSDKSRPSFRGHECRRKFKLYLYKYGKSVRNTVINRIQTMYFHYKKQNWYKLEGMSELTVKWNMFLFVQFVRA
jgi:hypothetical protein